jgi:hypothetical protein
VAIAEFNIVKRCFPHDVEKGAKVYRLNLENYVVNNIGNAYFGELFIMGYRQSKIGVLYSINA